MHHLLWRHTGRPLSRTKYDGLPATLLIPEIFITRVLPDPILAATYSFAIINKKVLHHNAVPLCTVINCRCCNRIIRNTTHIIPLKLSYLCKACNAGDVESPEICEGYNTGPISKGDTLKRGMREKKALDYQFYMLLSCHYYLRTTHYDSHHALFKHPAREVENIHQRKDVLLCIFNPSPHWTLPAEVLN